MRGYLGRLPDVFTRNRVLVALLVLAAAKSLLWTMAIPPWRAPDEPQHFGYIQHLSRERSIPLSGETFLYPDLFQSLERTNFAGVLGDETTVVNLEVRQENPAAGHPPLYYMSMLPAYWAAASGSTESQLYAVRAFGAIVFLLLIAVSYRFARLLFPDAAYLQIGVPLLMIFHPQLGFIGAGVMNDTLAVLLFTLFLYELCVFARGDFSYRRAAYIGLAAGLGMLTRSSFVMAFPIGLAAFIWLVAARKGYRTRLVKAAAIAASLSIAVCGWYYLRNYIELGYLQPTGRSERYGAGGWWDLWFHTAFRADLIASFIGNFSWMSMPLPPEPLYWFRRISQFAVPGFAAALAVGYWRRGWQVIKPWVAVMFTGILVLFVLSVTHFELTVGGAQGRYLFPAVFPFWSLVLIGLTGWMPPAWRPRAAAVVVAAAALFGVWAFMFEFAARVT